MGSTIKKARVAGFLYLIIVVSGVFGLMYVPSRLIVHGDPGATARRILASESLFRFSLANGIISAVVFLFLALALYRLFREVDQPLAALMVILALIQIPLGFVGELIQAAALVVVRGADFLSAFDQPQREALAMLFLRLDTQGTIASELLWGLWLFPLGLLVFRSGFIPRVLGVWLIANGFAYVTICLTGLLWPLHLATVNSLAFPVLLGEVALMLWLLVVGAKLETVAGPSVEHGATGS